MPHSVFKYVAAPGKKLIELLAFFILLVIMTQSMSRGAVLYSNSVWVSWGQIMKRYAHEYAAYIHAGD